MNVAARARSTCPLCSGSRHAPYVVVKGHAYHRCPDCGFAFLDPMPSPSDLEAEYQGHKGIAADYYPHASSRRRKAFFRALRLIRRIRGRSVIDIGCGGGFFVGAARLLGAAAATGVDVDASTIAYARRAYPGCEFHCVSLDRFVPATRYELVHCSEVIEHVPDPHVLMRLLLACCRPGGHVFITTPDLGSRNLPARIEQWPGFAPPVHTGLFTEENLCALFDRYGFKPVLRLPPRRTGMKLLFRLEPAA